MARGPSVVYQRRATGLPAVDGEFKRLEESLRSLGPLAGGLDIRSYTLVAGNNSLQHGLGRVPQGRFVLSVSAATTLFDVSSDAQFWVMNASAPATVKLIFI